MNARQRTTLRYLTAIALSTSLAGVAAAQQESFPREREQMKSCAEVDWNRDMIDNHPRLIEACREVVVAGDRHWARFEANFSRVEADGKVIFSIRDARDRPLEDVTLQPAAGQVAYIDNRATPFSQLRRDQRVNLYVPEGQYGFVTQPGAREQATVVTTPPARTPSPTRVATAEPRATMLPATASPLPWFALAGVLSLLGAAGLRLSRRR
jgi:LPXTG-motif cell wall-anchored protein